MEPERVMLSAAGASMDHSCHCGNVALMDNGYHYGNVISQCFALTFDLEM